MNKVVDFAWGLVSVAFAVWVGSFVVKWTVGNVVFIREVAKGNLVIDIEDKN